MTFLGGGSPVDPLTGMALPPGDPGSLNATAATYSGMAAGLQASSARQSQAVAGVGQAWLGNGVVSCEAAVGRVGASAGKIGSSAGNGATALRTCAAAWEAARAKWAQAQRLAAQAVADETAHRNAAAQMASAGNPAGHVTLAIDAMGLGYQSPERGQAVAVAQAAIDEFNRATNTARVALTGAAAPITPAGPAGAPGVGVANFLQILSGAAVGAGVNSAKEGSKLAALASKTRVASYVRGGGPVSGYWRTTPGAGKTWVDPYYRSGGPVSGYLRDNSTSLGWVEKGKWIGRGGVVLGFLGGGAQQYAQDSKNPNLSTTDRVGRTAGAAAYVGGASWAGGTAGAIAGGEGGAAIGTMIVPVVGTAIGGALGALVGGVVGSGAAGWAANETKGFAVDAGQWTANATVDAGTWVGNKISDGLNAINPF